LPLHVDALKIITPLLLLLTATNAKLAAQLETYQACIKKLKEEIDELKAKIKPAWQGQRPAKLTSSNNYC
jgi:phage host-nuclease inhibitor protein Gam